MILQVDLVFLQVRKPDLFSGSDSDSIASNLKRRHKIYVLETNMAWARSKAFLERVQLGSIILYLICLGGYTISAVGEVWDYLRADLFGFTFFSLFIASTILLRFEGPAKGFEGPVENSEGSADSD